jgi:hypothetical protein
MSGVLNYHSPFHTYSNSKPTYGFLSAHLPVVDIGLLQSFVEPALLDNVATRAAVALSAPTHDSLTFTAELGKTVHMFRNIGTRMGSLMSSTNPKDWASAWLEGRYGWRTLGYDLESIQDAVERLDKQTNFYRSTSLSTSSTAINDSTVIEWGSGATYTVTHTGKVDVSYRGFAIGKQSPPKFGGDIVVTAWELIPYSFVLDWFLDVGMKINYYVNSNPKLERAIGVGTKVTYSNQTKVNMTTTGSGNWELDSLDMTGTIKGTLLERDGFSPSLTPSLNVRLDQWKVLDILAMVVQRMR